MSTGELACTYASLILHDDGQEITADKINTIVKAAGITIEPYWAGLFAKVLASKKVGDLITNVGAGAPAAAAPAAGGAAAAPAAGGAKDEGKKKKEEPKEEEDEDMGFSLFD